MRGIAGLQLSHSWKSVPRIVTTVPPAAGPLFGVMDVIFGAAPATDAANARARLRIQCLRMSQLRRTAAACPSAGALCRLSWAPLPDLEDNYLCGRDRPC